jgi:hypothetical protein
MEAWGTRLLLALLTSYGSSPHMDESGGVRTPFRLSVWLSPDCADHVSGSVRTVFIAEPGLVRTPQPLPQRSMPGV